MNSNIILIMFCCSLNYLSSTNCKQNAELYLENPYTPVYDIIHNNTPRINLNIPDYLLLLSKISIVIKYLSIILLLEDDVYGKFIIKFNREIICLIYSFLLRGITTRLTIIPTCMPKPNIEKKTIYDNISIIIGYTHDLMYSGHTIMFIFLGKMIEENYNSNIFLYLSGNMIQFIFPLSIILARQHYTIDVVVAMIVYNFFNFGLNRNCDC